MNISKERHSLLTIFLFTFLVELLYCTYLHPHKTAVKVLGACILHVVTYDLETMTVTKKRAIQLQVMQKPMEQAILGISLIERKTKKEIR